MKACGIPDWKDEVKRQNSILPVASRTLLLGDRYLSAHIRQFFSSVGVIYAMYAVEDKRVGGDASSADSPTKQPRWSR